MLVLLKQLSGKTIVLDVDRDMKVEEFAKMAYAMRAEEQKNAHINHYAKSINLMLSGATLEYDKKLSDYSIGEGCSITETPKSFTMSPGFDWATLSIIDPIGHEDSHDPYSINPGCHHQFDKGRLRDWIRQKMIERQQPNCPSCRSEIPMSHVVGLLFTPQRASSSSSSSDTNAAPKP